MKALSTALVSVLVGCASTDVPSSPVYGQGMDAYHQNDYERAVELLSQVPEDDPKYATAMRYVGYNIYVREWNRPEEGISYLDRAYRAAPRDPKVQEDIVRGYAKAGRGFSGKVSLQEKPSRGDAYLKLSPFTAIRWKDSGPEVEVDKIWFVLLAINDVPTTDIVAFCKKTYEGRWQKRFGEDLVEVLTRMGRKPEAKVTLSVRAIDTGERRTLTGILMTSANRNAIRDATSAGAAEPGGGVLSLQQAAGDLQELKEHLEARYSYLALKGVDYRSALAAARSGLKEPVRREALAVEVVKVLSLFGDGHTRLEEDPLPPGYTPFLLGDGGDRVVAFKPDRTGFVDPAYPYLRRLDGVDLDRWLGAARKIVPAGSPQIVRSQSIRALRYIAYLRRELGLEDSATLQAELESADRTKSVVVTPRVSDRKPIYGTWPIAAHRVLEGNIGYLRIPEMGDAPAFLKTLVDTMARFRDTKGLIIDVRGNGGGSRAALRTLFPYFMAPGDPPHLANVAAYRLAPGEEPDQKEGYLQDRELYPLTSTVWSREERELLERFSGDFKPEWTPPPNGFTAWHYFILKRQAGPEYYHYARPVVILMDSDCFSATDIFLGAFKGRKNVTLVGTPSGGGSGRAKSVQLSRSGIRLRMSSIASFRPDGSLYDGKGVPPDVEVTPQATDWIGQTDTALDAALTSLRR